MPGAAEKGANELPPELVAHADSWDALLVAVEALEAVNAAGSPDWSRVGLRVIMKRAKAHLKAVEKLLEAAGE